MDFLLSLPQRIWTAFLGFCTTFADKFYLNFLKESAPGTGYARWRYLLDGLRITLEVALCAVLLGAFLGFLVAVVRTTYDKHGRLSFLNAICKVYLTVIRGTPMTVQLLIAYYVIFASSNNGTLVAIIAFGVNSGAYVAEIMRAGICSIDEGQMEAGRSLGMSYLQGLRHIVLPQAFRNVLPALGNEFIVLLKDTSIASFIALRDLSKGGEIIRSQTYDAFMPFLMVALVYLVIVMFFTKLLEKLERRLQSSNAH
ncbi:MAG: amino acid ABC transporter permease [Kiritimatiellia bacterium]